MAVPIVIYKEKPKQHSWARWMVARTMRKNQNVLASFIGKTGSGKTWSAMSVAETMSKLSGVPFNVENIVFDLRELMELINSGVLKRGSVIIFDEPQISISAREFQSLANRTFNYLVSTFRHKNFILFFCCPFENLLDKSTRKLFHARFETMSINANKKTCRLKPRFIEYSDFKELPYRKRMKIIVQRKEKETSMNFLDFWDVSKPTKDLIDAYELKKKEFTDNLNRNILEKLNIYNAEGKSMTAKVDRLDEGMPKHKRLALTEHQEKIMKLLANNRPEVAEKILGITIQSIHASKRQALAKGYTLREFVDKTEVLPLNSN